PATPLKAPLYVADPMPGVLQKELQRKNFALDAKSGHYLGPKVFLKTRKADLVRVMIGGSYVKDLRGRLVFVRQSIRDKLLLADAAFFQDKTQQLQNKNGV